jgi:hypothetical protein
VGWSCGELDSSGSLIATASQLYSIDDCTIITHWKDKSLLDTCPAFGWTCMTCAQGHPSLSSRISKYRISISFLKFQIAAKVKVGDIIQSLPIPILVQMVLGSEWIQQIQFMAAKQGAHNFVWNLNPQTSLSQATSLALPIQDELNSINIRVPKFGSFLRWCTCSIFTRVCNSRSF